MAFHALIIDDDDAFRKILERRLRAFIPLLTVTDFEAITPAREFLSNSRRTKELGNGPTVEFDLVILDEHLPDGRGTDLLAEGWFEGLAVLSVSSDNSPEIPGTSLKSGATFFLPKPAVSEPLFKPLVLGLIDRNKLQREVAAVRSERDRAETVRTLVATLRHEINNPLGAVLGAAYLMKQSASSTPEQKSAADLVESSGKRIKHVLDELCEAVAISSVTKADQQVFQIPGDKTWGESSTKEKK